MTFIDVFAASVRQGTESSGAGAVAHSARHRDALGSFGTRLASTSAVGQQTRTSDNFVRGLAAALDAVAHVTALKRVAFVAWWAGTVVASR